MLMGRSQLNLKCKFWEHFTKKLSKYAAMP